MTLVALKKAWRADVTGLFIPVLPALITTMICTFSIDWLNRKPPWILLACAFALAALSVRGGKSQGSIILPISSDSGHNLEAGLGSEDS